MNKSIKRFVPVISNSLRSVLIPSISILFSFIIVTYFSKQLWGEFVEILLFIYIATTFCNWGQREFLLREFSKIPKNITTIWQQFLIARLPILILFIIIAFVFYGNTLFFELLLWLSSVFIINSFTPIFIYERDYNKSIYIEIIGFFILLLGLFCFKSKINLILLVQLYAIHNFIKALYYLILYKIHLNFRHFTLQLSLLLSGVTFFLMSLGGFLQSRIDVYIFSIFYDTILLGEYQIISGFLIFAQSITMILILPYLKNIYRLTDESILKMKKNIAYFGIILNTIIITIIFILLNQLYQIQLNLYQLFYSFLITYPPYVYSLEILYLFKENKEKKVLKISFASMSINLIISFLLLSLGFKMTGVLVASAIAQMVSLFLYSYKKKLILYV